MFVDPDPDAIAGALGREPDVVAVTGYFGEITNDTVNLFLDPDLRVPFAIPLDQVAHRFRRESDDEKFGEYSVLWVRGEFMRSSTISDDLRATLAADFLFGEFALEMLLPQTVEEALNRVAYIAAATTMHTKHCPR